MATFTPVPNEETASAATPFDTRNGYQAAISNLINLAEHTLKICENDLAESDLGSLRNQQGLWAFFSQTSPGRMQLLLANTGVLAQRHPRFIQLCDRFGHLIEIRQIPDYLSHKRQGWMIGDDEHYLIRHHYDWQRGESGCNSKYAAQLKQQFATLWEQSTPCSASQRLDL